MLDGGQFPPFSPGPPVYSYTLINDLVFRSEQSTQVLRIATTCSTVGIYACAGGPEGRLRHIHDHIDTNPTNLFPKKILFREIFPYT
jgi:hypothetical protein